jgi:Cu+-exporting ATPase
MMTLFDASVFLIFFILAGRVLEAYAKVRVRASQPFSVGVLHSSSSFACVSFQTGDAVAMLGTLRPDSALLITSEAPEPAESLNTEVTHLSKTDTTSSSIDTKSPEGSSPTPPASPGVGNITTVSVPVDHLEINDLILVQPGSLPPTDGTIVRGATTFDESSLTGESKPVKKTVGDEVLTGTVNLTGAIVVRVEKLGEETMIEKIVRAVSEAQGQKSPVEYLAERVTGVFVPVVVRLNSLDYLQRASH